MTHQLQSQPFHLYRTKIYRQTLHSMLSQTHGVATFPFYYHYTLPLPFFWHLDYVLLPLPCMGSQFFLDQRFLPVEPMGGNNGLKQWSNCILAFSRHTWRATMVSSSSSAYYYYPLRSKKMRINIFMYVSIWRAFQRGVLSLAFGSHTWKAMVVSSSSCA